ncbi:vWA domain-containing protein [Polyangium mundeleinium]|uniref:VWA domain-containing protein n=1 Tax=Polyangium mundeleinium TaxID=2995306 RepID=A0ABT5EJL8_9BACT|nr:vWA domain-containing protein [Polyangium mundeleinium]MDC0741994.1 VWA domain-containing protein [Polyangium mundeleinium]
MFFRASRITSTTQVGHLGRSLAFGGRTPKTLCAFAALCVSSLGLACSASGDRNGQASNGVEETSGTGGGGGANPGSATGTGGDMFDFDGGMMSSGAGGEEACAQTGGKAEPVELDLVILLDRSGSMYGQNWNGATAAIKQFVEDPASTGINVGILYFPVDTPADGLVCNKNHYDDLSVPIGTLPGNAPALVQSINGESPNGGSTPMYGALEGALFNATAYKDAHPNHKVILVFASDGDPNSCPGNQNDIPSIAGLAKAALDYNGVETYVVAINGASVLNLDQIAASGGTTKSYDITANVSQFAQKMTEIRTKALACEFLVPEPSGGEPLELDKASVKHTNGAGIEQEIPHATSAADCGVGPGWYYDDPKTPQKILLCPASCQVVQADPDGKLDILFGCKPDIH